MIYTSYFAQLRNLPENIIPIAICGKSPDWYKGLEYKKLAPKWSFFSKWKKNHDNDYYIKHFNDEVLNKQDILIVYEELMHLSNYQDIALICYEKPEDFCHRHLVASWFNKNGIECEEWRKYIGS